MQSPLPKLISSAERCSLPEGGVSVGNSCRAPADTTPRRRTPLSRHQDDQLRAVLERSRADHSAVLAERSARLTALAVDAPPSIGSFDRALVALQMYVARAAIEEIDSALTRIETGTYGSCESCGRTMPFDQLETFPQARFCDAFPASAGGSAERPVGLRLGSSRDECTGASLARPGVLVASWKSAVSAPIGAGPWPSTSQR